MEEQATLPTEPQKELTVENKSITQEKTSTQEEINWKEFREKREVERKAKEQSDINAAKSAREAEALKAALDAVLNKPQSLPQDSSYPTEMTEDQRIEEKVNRVLKEKEDRFARERQERELAEFPRKLNQAYSDFDRVCTTENLDYLEFHYPEIAGAFKHSPDGFDKWSNIYKAVKRFVPNVDSRKEQAKIEKNANKPQAMSVSGVTQSGDSAPVKMDEQRRQDNWLRMQRVMKGG